MANEPTASADTTGEVIRNSLFTRPEDLVPTLTAAEIARLHRFGSVHRYADGEKLFETGKPSPGMFIILSGHIAVSKRDGLGRITPVIEQGPGQYLAEMAELSGIAALVDGTAVGDVEALVVPPAGIRTMLVAEADLGEQIMRTLILRRLYLIKDEAGGVVLIGSPTSGDTVRIQSFLTRISFPCHTLDPALDLLAANVVARYLPEPGDLPLAVCPDGKILRNPSEADLARALGLVGGPQVRPVYDVAVVGAGPAGLATAVYATSEGLSVVVLDARGYGGQAGASTRIENYLGFPAGVSGRELAGRAFAQALKFGANMMIPAEAKELVCNRADGAFGLVLDSGERVRARLVVIASGARYRRPAIENLSTFEGHGVWYWASPIEARVCGGQEVIIVGGGNSAGQAAVFLAGHAAKVRMMIRGDELADSMSRYLIDRITAAPNIELMTQTEIVALAGTPRARLEQVRWRNRRTGAETVGEVRNVFLFAGAEPATQWLTGCGARLDKAGFVVTRARRGGWRPATPLETTVPGVFAVGDVRSGSVKRVGSAIGEGAQVVPLLHSFLADGVGASAPMRKQRRRG
jgi:thioredoxin reductase (NADPH)